MPQIVEYVNRENIQPTDRGTEARVQEGRRIGAAYNQVAESLRDFGNRTAQELGGAIRDAGNAATQYAEHREISQGVLTYAQMQDTLTNQWNAIASKADPNDPSVRQQFIEGTLTPALQKWGDAFNTEGGQKWAQARTSALLDHMYQKTAADMGTLAAKAIEGNLATSENVTANTAYNDPSSLDFALKHAGDDVNDLIASSQALKGTVQGEANRQALTQKRQEQIAKSGIIGGIAKSTDPVGTAEAMIAKYSQYLTPADQQVIRSHAHEQVRADRADQANQRTIARQERQDRSDQAEDTILKNLYSDDPKKQSQVSSRSIANNPDLTPEKRRQLVSLVEREQKPETNNRISAATTVDLLRKLRDPNANLDQLMTATWDARLKDPGQAGSLTERDFNTVRNEIIGRKTPEGADLARDRDEFFKRYAPTIDAGMTLGEHTAAGAQAMYQAQTDAKRQERVLQSKGIDPHELYDPRSPNFFGNPKNLDKYRQGASLQEINKERSNAIKGGAPTYVKPPPFEPLGKTPEMGGASFSDRFNALTGVNPTRIRQGGHVYERQPDGSMKAVE